MASPTTAGTYSKAALDALYAGFNTTGDGFSEQSPAAYGNMAAPAFPQPLRTATSGGTVAAGTYLVAVSYVNASGETVASATNSVTTTGATSTLIIPSPAAATSATGWYAYVSQVNGSTLTRQQTAGSPTAIATGLTLTAPPTSTGAAPPAANSAFTGAGASMVIHIDPSYRVWYNPTNSQVNVEVPVADTASGIRGWQLVTTYTAT